MAAKRTSALVAIAASLAFALAGPPAAGAATIAPPSFDFGTVMPGSRSATQLFTVTGPVGDPTVEFAGPDDPPFEEASDSCTGFPLTSTMTCTIGVYLAPPGEEGDTVYSGRVASLLHVGHWQSGNTIVYDAEALLTGFVPEVGEEGGRGKRGGSGTLTKKKCKKIKNKAKRKKCLKKLQQQGGTGRRR